ncbi:MAG TPA: type II TA system antitoxin MqsA family protein [Tepidisphaeraceae bacterium]|jgi:putative zinc finger/helix-turn-helix YgiT family protein
MINKQHAAAGERRRNYPIRCINCGKKAVSPVIARRHTVTKNHDGRAYDLVVEHLPVTRCQECGETFFTDESDDRINVALRERLGLLTPEQIRANLDALGLTQKELSDRIGVAAETLSRWLSGGMIQSRAMDNLLRTFFAVPEVRQRLTGSTQDRAFGASVVHRSTAKSKTPAA